MKMKKIVLINPNHHWNTDRRVYHNKHLMKLRKVTPPLGLAYMASVLRKENEVTIIDSNALNFSVRKTITLLKESDPDVIAITSFYPMRHAVVEFGRHIAHFRALKIVGGADATAVPHEYTDSYDLVVEGEGIQIIRSIVDGSGIDNLPGVVFRKDGKLTRNAKNVDPHFNEYPFPSWDLLPIRRYKPETMMLKYKLPAAMLMTSKGCPYKCSFCTTSVVFPKMISRSPRNVFAEIEHLYHRQKVRHIMFCDDVLTTNRKNLIELCKLIIDNKIKITWSCYARPELVDQELLNMMKEAGCFFILYGVQSASEDSLKRIDRLAFYEHIKKATLMTKRAGMMVRYDFLLGLPGETGEDMMKSVEMSIKLNPDIASFYPLLMLPKSKLEMMDYKPRYSNEHLERISSLAYKRFHFRSQYVFSQMKNLTRPTYIKRYLESVFAFMSGFFSS